jgi:long-chain acyl-CoA synthetase
VLASGKVFELRPDDVALSFLPRSHVFERTVLYIYMHFGVQICYARGVETVGDDIKEIRPTVVTAVPRLFEKNLRDDQQTRRRCSAVAAKNLSSRGEAWPQAAMLRDAGKSVPLPMRLELKALDKLVFSKWRAAVGGRLRFLFRAARPCRQIWLTSFWARGY